MAINDIFVVMPFAEQVVDLGAGPVKYPTSHFDDVYALVQEAALAHRPTVVCERMEKKHGNLVAAIVRRIHSADLVVAVLTGRNPNVFYELGVRHALRRRTIMLVSDRREYPFDLQGYYSEQYSVATAKDRAQLKGFLAARFAEYDQAQLDDSPVLDVLEAAEREQWRALNNWETRRAALHLRRLLMEMSRLASYIDAWIAVLNVRRPASAGSFGNAGYLRRFAQDCPVPGLPVFAYADIDNFAIDVDEAVRVLEPIRVKHHSAAKQNPKRKVASGDMKIILGVIPDLHRRYHLLAADLWNALEYVMERRSCHSIPWSNRLDGVDTISTLEALNDLITQFNAQSPQLSERYSSFEDSFSGAPPL